MQKTMNVRDLAEKLELTAFALPDADRTAEGVYIGDLLSWVMGRAQSGQVWITIMSNINVIAVASLSDVACVVLAEGVTVEESILEAANQRGINLLGSEKSAYEIALELSRFV